MGLVKTFFRNRPSSRTTFLPQRVKFWLVVVHGIFDICIVQRGFFTLSTGAQGGQGDTLVRL